MQPRGFQLLLKMTREAEELADEAEELVQLPPFITVFDCHGLRFGTVCRCGAGPWEGQPPLCIECAARFAELPGLQRRRWVRAALVVWALIVRRSRRGEWRHWNESWRDEQNFLREILFKWKRMPPSPR